MIPSGPVSVTRETRNLPISTCVVESFNNCYLISDTLS